MLLNDLTLLYNADIQDISEENIQDRLNSATVEACGLKFARYVMRGSLIQYLIMLLGNCLMSLFHSTS